MKKWLLLLLPLILLVALMACESSSDNSAGSNDVDSSPVSNPESSVGNNENNVSYVGSEPTTSSENKSEIISKQITGIYVTVIGEDELSNNGYFVDDSFNLSVNITIKGNKATVESLTASDFTATIDVSTVAESGDDIELLINYTAPAGIEVTEKTDFATLKISKKNVEITPPSNSNAYMSNNIIVSGNRGMEPFGGSSAAGALTAEKLNEFKTAVGTDVTVYILPCPAASAFYAPDKYPNSIQNHINCFNGLRDNLVDVKYVDTLTALSTHTDEYIYYRTDFHWTGLGGYYAAQALASVAGTPFDDISTYTEHSVTDCFKGGLTSYASVLAGDPDDVYWYVPSREHTVTYYSQTRCESPISGRTLFSANNGYTKFIYGDSYTTHIQSNVGNGRKLLIFKDSYGNALAPYVLSSFDEVYLADYRYFELNAIDFIEEKGITDVCFAMSAFSVAGSKRNNITRLINN